MSEKIPKRKLLSSLSRGAKVVIGTVVTAVITGLVGLFFTINGAWIGDRFTTDPPVHVVVQNQADPTVGGVVYALPESLAPHPAAVRVGPELAAIVRDHRATEVQALDLKLILSGQRGQGVVITDIRARTLERQPPLDGTLLLAPSQGVNTSLEGCLYLDSARPVVLAPDRALCTRSGRPYFAGHYLTLGPDEPIVVDLQIIPNDTEAERPHGDDGYYEFELVLDAILDGEPTQIPIRNGASPFRVTSYAPQYSAMYRATTDDPTVLNSVDARAYCHPSCSAGIMQPGAPR